MSARVSFDVAGMPAPQGSMRAFVRNGHAVVSHARRASLEAWRIAVAQEARAAMHAADLFGGSLAVRIVFRLPRPSSHTGKRGLLPSAPLYPITAPDADKLLRAVLDALTGVVWLDDAQVGHILVRKDYAAPGQSPGASVDVWERVA